MTGEEVESLTARLSGALGFTREQAGQEPRGLRAGLTARAKDPTRVLTARLRLIGAGAVELLVRDFPPAQIILLDEKRDYEARRDEEAKLLALAPWQIDALLTGTGPGQGGDGLFAGLMPDVVAVRRAQGRVEQRVALLRHVEAVRLYAAGHGGRPPSRLSEAGVPLPPDPFTGLPFRYSADGATAHLRGSPPPGEEQNPVYNVRYEITIRK